MRLRPSSTVWRLQSETVGARFTGDREFRNATVHLAREGGDLVILVAMEKHAFPAWKSERGEGRSRACVRARPERDDGTVSRMKIYERRFGDRVGVAPEIHLVPDRLWPLLRVTNRILHVARETCHHLVRRVVDLPGRFTRGNPRLLKEPGRTGRYNFSGINGGVALNPPMHFADSK